MKLNGTNSKEGVSIAFVLSSPDTSDIIVDTSDITIVVQMFLLWK